MGYATAAAQALFSHDLRFDGTRLHVPGSATIRLSTVLGNRRIHRLMAPSLRPGAVVVDVGANIGCNTVYAASRVGPSGQVIAIEPAADNLAVLRRNVADNGFTNVSILAAAAGKARGSRSLYLRGEVSAVNSFFEQSIYAAVTGVVSVPVVALDEVVEAEADLVKIDVEGAELDVLGGMTRLLRGPRLRLVVEWHPLLQEQAGYQADDLPLALLGEGFSLLAASHTTTTRLVKEDLGGLVVSLSRSGRPVDLLATRP